MSEPNALLQEVLVAHGLTCRAQQGWLLPSGRLPAISATWLDRTESGRLDVFVLIAPDTILQESFAGSGAGEGGLRDAFVNFSINSFHVLLAALWSVADPEQVTIEEWMVNGRRFRAVIGNFGTRASAGCEPDVPPQLFAAIHDAIQAEPLDRTMHWFRFFFCNLSGDFTFEALKDNVEWTAGISCLANAGWQAKPGYYSARLFLILVAI